jgi:2-oxoisovalerate dehydrogenase E1 component
VCSSDLIALYPMRDLHDAGDGGWMMCYPDPSTRIRFGNVGVHGAGEDLAILTFGNGAYLSRQAQKRLAADGIYARVIDMRWLSPIPEESIIAAIAGCRNVLVVDETRRTGGVAEALMALLTERAAVPHARLTAQDSFIATGPAYGATMPSSNQIVEAALALVKGRI